MSSKRQVIVINLDKHYQRFLRKQFNCYNDIFEFPNKHKFNTILEFFVSNAPDDFTDPDWGENSFKILLPSLEYENDNLRYLSVVKEKAFKSKIREYYEWIIIDRVKKMMALYRKDKDGIAFKFDREQATIELIDEYGFDQGDCDSFDRLYKLVTRYNRKEIARRYYENLKIRRKDLSKRILC
jgi:hypothetical protein